MEYTQHTMFMVAGKALEDSDKTLERECPPQVYRTEEQQIVINMKRRMMVWAQVESQVDDLQVLYIASNIRAISRSPLRSHCPCTSKVDSRN